MTPRRHIAAKKRRRRSQQRWVRSLEQFVLFDRVTVAEIHEHILRMWHQRPDRWERKARHRPAEQGELYPCKPDIFAATYEPVEAAR